MGAESRIGNLKRRNTGDDSGQSVLEFLIVLPMLVAVLTLIIRVNTVIQMSIVDQKYSRAQVFFINGNGAEYPLRGGAIVNKLAKGNMNQLVIGVAQDQVDESVGSVHSAASTYYIGRRPAMSEENDSGDQIRRRLNVRVRNAVTICTPLITINGTPTFDFTSTTNPIYNMPEQPQAYQFCSSALGEG